jgi:hypothetical protein
MTRYRFVSTWDVDAPVERVWDALLQVREWPTWWSAFRSVEPLADGDDRGIGMRIRQQWRGPLPLTTTIDLEIIDLKRHRLLVGRASGEMTGRCTWTFDEVDAHTRVAFVLDVRPTRWWMNLPVPFAGRVFAWNVRSIMHAGCEGLGRRLGSEVVGVSPDPVPVGA